MMSYSTSLGQKNVFVRMLIGLTLRICSNAPSFSALFIVKNALCNPLEILLSASSRMSLGSCRPAFANSIRDFGRVAEIRSVCLDWGRAVRISVNCAANPWNHQ